MTHSPHVSVLMPTYNQDRFICRALDSLLAQTFEDWELIIIDDGSTDSTHETIQPYLTDTRVRHIRLHSNRGLGAALNVAMEIATGKFISYLPSDDVYYENHLNDLVSCLDHLEEAVLAFSGIRHQYNRFSTGHIEGTWLQLVQTMHRKTVDRWLERTQLVTDDLARMFWSAFSQRGQFVGTGRISCEWVDHPMQRHKIVQEPVGGINPYRVHYDVRHPMRFHTSVGNFIDEVDLYRPFRDRPDTPPAPDGLKILLVGELAYNAERVLALEERGHTLYGLWTSDPYWYNTVGPVPFGHIVDLPRHGWQEHVAAIKPDIIYALLNWQAVPFAHHVLKNNPGIPFVWHFKEGPFICLEKGTWDQLIDLHLRSDGQIYSSPEMRDWYHTVAPDTRTSSPSLVLDGDLPKADWLRAQRAPRLSESREGFHTVVPGRPIGLRPCTVRELAEYDLHLHFYGDFTRGQWREWVNNAMRLAPNYLHLHPNVTQARWVTEFSQYDAGWLHFFSSRNEGKIRRADWDDLNYPARMATLAAAGLPMLQKDNTGAIVAAQSLARKLDLGLFFTDIEELAGQLREKQRMDDLRTSVWNQRDVFTFDYHADCLVAFFRQVLASRAHT